jgi:hypothetical protein
MADWSEIEAGADALKCVWENNEAEAKRLGRPAGLAWVYMARVVLDAAETVRGKPVLRTSPLCGETLQ